MKDKKKVAEIEEFTLYPEEEGSPLRSIVCLKQKADMKLFEKIYDCFILDFDPAEPLPSISTLSLSSDDDLFVTAEKGQVACRDYPHARHLCLNYPFETTPHENFCHLCHCYVCDSVAPCKYWESLHCHAIDNDAWKLQRNNLKREHSNPMEQHSYVHCS